MVLNKRDGQLKRTGASEYSSIQKVDPLQIAGSLKIAACSRDIQYSVRLISNHDLVAILEARRGSNFQQCVSYPCSYLHCRLIAGSSCCHVFRAEALGVDGVIVGLLITLLQLVEEARLLLLFLFLWFITGLGCQ
jgi:hypothetical protein